MITLIYRKCIKLKRENNPWWSLVITLRRWCQTVIRHDHFISRRRNLTPFDVLRFTTAMNLFIRIHLKVKISKLQAQSLSSFVSDSPERPSYEVDESVLLILTTKYKQCRFKNPEKGIRFWSEIQALTWTIRNRSKRFTSRKLKEWSETNPNPEMWYLIWLNSATADLSLDSLSASAGLRVAAAIAMGMKTYREEIYTMLRREMWISENVRKKEWVGRLRSVKTGNGGDIGKWRRRRGGACGSWR